MRKKLIKNFAGFLAGVGVALGIAGCYGKNENKQDSNINWVTRTKELEQGAVLGGNKVYYTTGRGIYGADVARQDGKYVISNIREIIDNVSIKTSNRNCLYYDNGKIIFFRNEPNKDRWGTYRNILSSYDIKSGKQKDLCAVDEDFSYYAGLSSKGERGMVVRLGGEYKIIPIDRESKFSELKSYNAESEPIKDVEERTDKDSELEEKLKDKFGYVLVLEDEKNKPLVVRKNYDIGFIDRQDLEAKK